MERGEQRGEMSIDQENSTEKSYSGEYVGLQSRQRGFDSHLLWWVERSSSQWTRGSERRDLEVEEIVLHGGG